MAKCYPKIKDYCREKHGLEFQVSYITVDRGSRSANRYKGGGFLSRFELIVNRSVAEARVFLPLKGTAYHRRRWVSVELNVRARRFFRIF